MELTHLRYFVVVLDVKNIMEASRSLRVSQSTLTGVIQRLEQELGVSLFNRSGRKLIPTQSAWILRDYASDLFQNLENMRSDIADSLLPAQLRVALDSPAIMTKLLVFQERHPQIPLNVKRRPEKDYLYYLQNDLFDLCVTSEQIDDPGIVCEKLLDDYLWISAPKSNPLANQSMVRVRDLKTQTIIVPNRAEEYPIFLRFIQCVQEQNIFLKYVVQGTTEACAELARRTDHLLLLSSLDRNTWDLGKSRRFVLINPTDHVLLPYYVAYRKDKKLTQEEVFIDWMKHGCYFLKKKRK